jgi:hypothetical protein
MGRTGFENKKIMGRIEEKRGRGRPRANILNGMAK